MDGKPIWSVVLLDTTKNGILILESLIDSFRRAKVSCHDKEEIVRVLFSQL